MKVSRLCALFMVLMLLLLGTAFAESDAGRWGEAANQIDKLLEAAFEYYLAGDSKNAYDSVNNAYFRVYETKGFERQTMSYVSGPRKNAVELQFSTAKAAVKKSNEDEETKGEVRAALFKLKSMIREDGNKLAVKDGEAQTVLTYWQNGEQIDHDPYPEYASDPDAAVRYKNWHEAYEAMTELLDTSATGYRGKDSESAIDNFNTTFYTVYEESGLSHKIYSEIGIDARETVDGAFASSRAILKGEKFQPSALERSYKALKKAVLTETNALDALAPEQVETESQTETVEAAPADNRAIIFAGAFGIIVREGLEAILVIAAIIAYLTKSGNRKSLKNVYIGAILGIVASFVAALILFYLKKAFAGAGMAQELIEGITALIAVCVLFYVSNWMISKAEADAWSGYIESKVQEGVERRSSFTLAFTAFLSVFREGAEVVLFYQPMLSEGHPEMVWAGFVTGCLVLVVVYILITKLSVKLPIRVFFTATSILMAVMCVAFLGSGIKELAEGGLFDMTLRVPGIPENDVLQIFGIYPYLETLVPQLILAIILLVTFLMAHYRSRIAALQHQLKKK